MKTAECIVIDIGGSSIKSALACYDGKNITLLDFELVSHSCRNIDGIKDLVFGIVRKHLMQQPILKIVSIATAGFVERTNLVTHPLFSGYLLYDWSTILRSHFSKLEKVYVHNDGQCAALGVALAENTARKVSSLVHFVIGTGVGGGIIINNKIWQGYNGFSGHFGHMIINEKSRIKCSCTSFGCVETMASGSAIERQARSISLKSHCIRDLSEQLERPAIAKLFIDAGEALAKAVVSVIRAFDPELVTLGGGVVEAARRNGENLYAAATIKGVTALTLDNWRPCPIKVSTLKNTAILYGAAATALGCKISFAPSIKNEILP
jgi:glucokinase